MLFFNICGLSLVGQILLFFLITWIKLSGNLKNTETLVLEQEHRLTLPFEGTDMVIRSTQSIVDLLLQNYVFTDARVAYSSVIIGILACKMVYGLSRMIGAIYFKSYSGLPKSHQIEWNNRAMSTLHALFITTASLYFVFWSDLYSNDEVLGPITLRRSTLSSFALGVSAGYFFSDLGMIIWFYPSLGGMEYVIHHLLSVVGVSYAMLTGEAQVYTYMVLTSEATTPWINLRWYLDEAGMKNSRLYLTNGIIIFLAWLVARILLFVYLFYHTYVHYGQVKQMHASGVVLVLVVPFIISVMNFVWFGKIFKGLKKTLAKRKKIQ